MIRRSREHIVCNIFFFVSFFILSRAESPACRGLRLFIDKLNISNPHSQPFISAFPGCYNRRCKQKARVWLICLQRRFTDMFKILIILFVLYLLFGRRRERRGLGSGLFTILAMGAGFILIRVLMGVFVLAFIGGILMLLRTFMFIF